MMRRRETLIIDGSGFLWRAFSARPPRTSSDGTPIHAVEGLVSMVLKPVLERSSCDEVAVVFDYPGPTFRSQIYAGYKANRAPHPEDFVVQKALAREAVRAFGIACLDVPGVEADDVIATLTRRARENGRAVVISSSDKDLMQLVRPDVRIYNQQTRTVLREDDVRKRFGVEPEQVPDVQALTGDAIDGVPGVPGIGPKIAARLVGALGDVERVIAAAGTITPPRIGALVERHAEDARLAKRLVSLKDDVDGADVDIAFTGGDPRGARAFVDRLGLPSYLAPLVDPQAA